MEILSNIGAQLNLAIAQNADFGPVTLTFTNADGTPVDLTGCNLAADLKKTPTGPVVEPFTCTITSPTTGVATLYMSAATTASLPCGASLTDPASAYVWDLKLTTGAAVISRPLWGNVTVWREVTP